MESKQLNREGKEKKVYPPITEDNVLDAARGAAYVAIRRMYMPPARNIKRKGVIVNRDGNTGGDPMLRKLYQGFAGTLNAATKKWIEADMASDIAAPAPAPVWDELDAKTVSDIANESNTNYATMTACDTDDCIQEAAWALSACIRDNDGNPVGEDAWKTALQAVRNYVYGEDNNTSTRIRRKYDKNGNLLSLKEYQYAKYPHKYIEQARDDGTWDVVDVHDELSELIDNMDAHDTYKALAAILDPAQRELLRMVSLKYTYETMAKYLKCSNAAARKAVERLRRKCRKALETMD